MCCRCLRNIDPDSVFAYNTPKIVRVKDRYLGLLRFVLLVMVACYILIKVLYIDEGYNISDVPVGTVRVSLMKQVKQAEQTTVPSKEIFCLTNTQPWDFPAEANISCQTWDEHGVRFPLEEVNGIFLTTRVAVSEQTKKCGSDENECLIPWEDDEPPTTYFLAGVNNFTLGFKHSFHTPVFARGGDHRFAGSSNAFIGDLLDTKGNVVRTWKPTYDDTPDILTVGEMLNAANVDLSRPSWDPKNSELYSGIVVMVLVNYENPSNGAIKYQYQVQQIEGADYKLFEARWDRGGDSNKRQTLKRAGPKLIFIVTGTLTKFDFQTLLVQMVSAMGLLSIAALLVEMCMLYAMPLRSHYAKVKYEETEDFSDVRDQMRLDPHQQSSAVNDLNAALLDLRETGLYRESDDGANGHGHAL